MAVAFDAITNSTLTSFTHTPVGTPRGVLILFTDDTTLLDRVSSVTYGGVAVTEVALSPLTNDGTDDHVIHGFFLGAGIPTGAQTVAYTASAGTQRVGCITYTAAADMEVKDTSTISDTVGGSGDRTVTLSLGGASCACAEAFGTDFGAVTSFGPLANWTLRRESDEGTNCTGLYTYDIVGTADVAAGVAFGANTGQIGLLAVAVGEVAAGGGINGTASITEDADTAAATGALAITGVASITEAADTLAATGTLAIVGTASIAEEADSLSAAGSASAGIAGELAVTEDDDTVSAMGRASAYPAYPKRKRIQVQRRDGTVTEVASEEEARALLATLADRQARKPFTQKSKPKPAVKAAGIVASVPALELFRLPVAPTRQALSEAAFVRMMQAAATAALALQEEEDIEMLLLVA